MPRFLRQRNPQAIRGPHWADLGDEAITGRHITVHAAQHPAPSFIAAQRIQAALRDQPRYTAVTAAKLVSELIDDLTRRHAVTELELVVTSHPGGVRITLREPGSASQAAWRPDGLARLLLDRLAASWMQEPDFSQISFELATGLRSMAVPVAR